MRAFQASMGALALLTSALLLSIAPLPAQAQKITRVACVGDSITFGYGIANRERDSYPARLQVLLGSRYEVQNFGLSGSGVLKKARRAGSGWKRHYASHPQFEASVAFRPDIVVINLGINDVVHWVGLGGEFEGDYRELIRHYRSLPSKPKVFIWHRLAPLFEGHAYHRHPDVKRLNAAIGRVAKRLRVPTIDLEKPLVEHPEWFPDRIHPNEGGARRIAEVVAEAIAPDRVAAGRTWTTGFEKAKVGTLLELETEVGTWKAARGHAEINADHVNSGKRSLRVLGGTKRTIELGLPKGPPPGELSFVAERWTRRAPFAFRIERRSRGRWSEVYDGDRAIKVGGFHTAVRVPLGDEPIDRLRFVCTSPEGSGILIDDVALNPATPQRVTGVTVVSMTRPALVGTAASPIELVRIDVEGTKDALGLVAAAVDAQASTSALETLQVFGTGANASLRAWRRADAFAGASRLGAAVRTRGKAKLTFRGDIELKPGANYLWLAGTVRSGADIDGRVGARFEELRFSDGSKMAPARQGESTGQRMGVALRRHGQDGVDTARIPGLVRTNEGTLIAVYDLRHESGGDLPGHIDVGMSRSTDGGRTWEPMRTIMDMGKDPAWKGDGVGDPAVLVDRQTNTIWVAGVWSHGNRAWWGSGPGLTPEETGQFLLVKSTDDGKTWSEPINITSQIKRPEWCYLLQGPGKGITMRDGTLVFAAQFQDTPENKRLPRSTIIFSKDRGETWQIGTGAHDDTTEAQVVEIEPGVLMLNCRYNRAPHRVVMITRDLGQTWQSYAGAEKLTEPGTCMASLIHVGAELGTEKQDWLLFSNPDSRSARKRITIKASSDRGMTWPRTQQVLLDDGVGAGYSCMAMIDAETVGILYEGSLAHMTFQRVRLKDLMGQPSGGERGAVPSERSRSLALDRPFGSGGSHPGDGFERGASQGGSGLAR